jgi:hypothetical protein
LREGGAAQKITEAEEGRETTPAHTHARADTKQGGGVQYKKNRERWIHEVDKLASVRPALTRYNRVRASESLRLVAGTTQIQPVVGMYVCNYYQLVGVCVCTLGLARGQQSLSVEVGEGGPVECGTGQIGPDKSVTLSLNSSVISASDRRLAARTEHFVFQYEVSSE